MADAAISFAVEKLGDVLINKVKFLLNVADQVEWLKKELQTMKDFLQDAAEKQSNKENGNLIRRWISDVREVAEEAEDVIEIFSLKMDKPTPRRKRDLVRKWAGNSVHVSRLNRVGKEIESIQNRLRQIKERREMYGIRNLGEAKMDSSSEMFEVRRRMAVLNQEDKGVVGLNHETNLLVNEVILDEKRKGRSLSVIVGMGGIGKSTLARKIYNHPSIAAQFELRAWVVVSNEFAAEDILMQIMHDLAVPMDANELETLKFIQGKPRRQEMMQGMLRNRLKGKRYFIVLDDTWEKTHWKTLETAFPDEQDKASRLLFTSRNQIITEHQGYVHAMKHLKPNESLELLLKTASIDRRCSPELEKIGKEILEKCHGLPLAIIVAGGLLVNQRDSRSVWEKVLKQIKNYHSETSEIGKSVSTILELSYHNLPSRLKPCFLCLAFFKEDAPIQVKKLMHIWVALGLVHAGEESVEETARSYLHELINRNLVFVKRMSIDDRVRYCYIHDLLRELSIRKAMDEIGFESLTSEHNEASSSSSKSRHCVVRGMDKVVIQSKMSSQKKHLRSLVLYVEGPNDDAYFSTPSYWKGFELLRILVIEGSRLVSLASLPSTVGALIGLRYLRLREEKGVLRVPSWLDALKNLEILDIGCFAGVEFPNVTWEMDNLRHFYIDSSHCSTFSDSMKKSSWKNLETLKYVRADNVLQGFSSHLRKLGVEMPYEGVPEFERFLVESQVQELHLRIGVIVRSGALSIPSNLDHLTKLKLHGSMYLFPTSDKFPQNITHLTLSNSGISKNDPLQELGKLPKLLVLKLYDVFYPDRVSIKVSHDGFPMLKLLHLRHLHWLENIEIEEGGMPQLQRLQIQFCAGVQEYNNLRESLRHTEIIVSD